MPEDPFKALRRVPRDGGEHYYYALSALESAGFKGIERLPICIRIVLESVLRNCGKSGIEERDVRNLANWNAQKPISAEIPFVVARILLQDFTGVPLLVDLAAMRTALVELGRDPASIEPQVPVDLVVDHSLQVDSSGTSRAFLVNLDREFERNAERYSFLKWGQQAFETFSVVPPGVGIVHQVNLEHLARLLFAEPCGSGQLLYPDSLVGTDSHTTMINGLGIVGWGVGGIEAEAGMLGQAIAFQTPEVVGVHMSGKLSEGITATDLALRVTELLRSENVVGKFVEFFGRGAAELPVADRATLANMAPEYGATMGFFPVDERSLEYLALTGRAEEHLNLAREYFKAQGIFGMPEAGQLDYTRVLELDLSSIKPSVAGPKRPQDRIELPELKGRFNALLEAPVPEGGYGLKDSELESSAQLQAEFEREGGKESSSFELTHGSVLIAAITSCTNTSNPSVMLAAGLLAKNAVARGLKVPDYVKCSLAPGSRVVSDYLENSGLQPHLDALGFNLVGYGCTTCIGNSGPLNPDIEAAVKDKGLVAASVLSGNRNFEARVHPSLGANFLMSPPLVVAFALAGRVDIDFSKEPLGMDAEGKPVFLRELWPSADALQQCVLKDVKAELFKKHYGTAAFASPQWQEIQTSSGIHYAWEADSSYIQKPPFFENFALDSKPIEPIENMRVLAILGDSVTTDHISPAGAIGLDTPAGRYLLSLGVKAEALNSYGSRRGNDRVMTRGTFANVRLRNQMAEGKQGGFTKGPDGEITSIYEAAESYKANGVPLIVFGGHDYGMGSSRDWAAKGTALLGVKAVVARSFERIHRSNLIGMGVLPLCFPEGYSTETLEFDGSEIFSLPELSDSVEPGAELELKIDNSSKGNFSLWVQLRIDTGMELNYYRHGGILPYVLRNLIH